MIEEARAAADEAVTIAEKTDSPLQKAHAQYAVAEVLAAAHQFAAALTAVEKAIRLYTTLERKIHVRRATALAEQLKHETAAVAAPTSRA